MLWRNTKRGFWAVAIVVGPIVAFYELNRFLYDDMHHGHWLWFSLYALCALVACVVADLIAGRYGPWRKPLQEVKLPGQDWAEWPLPSD